MGIEGTVGQRGQRGDRGQCEAADACGLEEGTASRGRGAVRGLHRAGADFITLSITDSAHISGGRGRSAQPAALPRGPRGRPGCRGTGAGLVPPGWAPCTHRPWDGHGGLPVGQQSPQTGPFPPVLCREAATNLLANHPSPSTLPGTAPRPAAGADPGLQSHQGLGSPASAPQGEPSSKSPQVIFFRENKSITDQFGLERTLNIIPFHPLP